MIVFKTTFPNGKIYIGQTIRKNINKYFGSGVKVLDAIEYFGRDNISKEILVRCKNQKQLDIWEAYYIKKFNSQDENIGYNILPGTANKFSEVNPASLLEVRKKISDSNKKYFETHDSPRKGIKLTNEEREHLRLINLDKKASSKTKDKMSESQFKRWNDKDSKWSDPNFRKEHGKKILEGWKKRRLKLKLNNMQIVGIDPGKSGAIVILREGREPLIQKMPETPKGIFNFLKAFSKNSYCFLEKVHGMPSMSGGGMFRFGEGFGWLQMALIANNIPTEQVTPQKWMKYFEMGTKGVMTGTQWKNKLKAKSQQMYPKVNVTLQTADALLIAEYGRRYYNANLKH